MPKTPEDLARALFDALQSGDFAAWTAAMAPGFTCSYPGLRGDQGREDALAFNQVFPLAFPDINFTGTASARSGERVYLSWSATGTHTGPLHGPEGTLSPTGRCGTLPGILVAQIAADRLLREETYWNIPDLLAQLMPQRAAA